MIGDEAFLIADGADKKIRVIRVICGKKEVKRKIGIKIQSFG